MRPGSRIRNVIAASVMMLFVTYYVNATDALQSAMAAKAAVLQSEKALEAAELQIRSEVVMAYESYQTAEISWIHMHPPFQKMLKPYWKIEYSVINREIPVCSNFSKRNMLMMRF